MTFSSDFQDRAQDMLSVIGDPITYTPAAFPHPTVGQTLSINGVFERPFVEAGNIESSVPTVEVMAQDVTPKQGDKVQKTGDSTVFEVVGVHPDGTGSFTLILEKA